MVENKYPEYVTTDSDMWNSADEAYFFVTKKKAKPLTTIITPIIEEALECGLLREATEEEIEEYELEQDIEKRIREGRFESGKNREETIENYNKWKENYDKNKKILKPTSEEFVKKSKIVKTVDEIKNKVPHVDGVDDYVELSNKEENKTPIKTLTPTENALKQKASVRSDNM